MLTKSQKTVLAELAKAGPQGLNYRALPNGCGRSLSRLQALGLAERCAEGGGWWVVTIKGRDAANLIAPLDALMAK